MRDADARSQAPVQTARSSRQSSAAGLDPAHAQSKGFREIQALSPGWEPDFGSLYNFPLESRMSMILEVEIGRNGIEALGFLPTFINRDAQPEPLEPGDSRFAQILEYMAWCNTEGACNARFKADGPRVRVLPPD